MTGRACVVLRHEGSADGTHRDLLIDGAPEGKLFAWRLAGPLPARVGESVAAARNFDHRRLYLDFEGEISGGRGTVARERRGTARDERGAPDSPHYIFVLEHERYELEGGELRRLA